jgi:hypothetical protein
MMRNSVQPGTFASHPPSIQLLLSAFSPALCTIRLASRLLSSNRLICRPICATSAVCARRLPSAHSSITALLTSLHCRCELVSVGSQAADVCSAVSAGFKVSMEIKKLRRRDPFSAFSYPPPPLSLHPAPLYAYPCIWQQWQVVYSVALMNEHYPIF